MKTKQGHTVRLESIDVFRAVTMLTMIFVNDLWTLQDVPAWLEHSHAEDDAMGLSDVVFPAFLFIVGLSIPYAIGTRKARGETWVPTLTHIFERTFALLLMGVFIVNHENTTSGMTIIPGFIWAILMVVAFFMIYNQYPDLVEKRILYTKLRLTGWATLVLLAVIYRGGDADEPTGMETHWWGILGLIGWAYFLCAPVYLFTGDRWKAIGGWWLFFVLFNVMDFAGLGNFLDPVKRYVWIVGSGSMPAFVMAGVFTSVLYRSYQGMITPEGFVKIFLFFGFLCFVFGFIFRPFWGISKIMATPAWVGICTGISFVLFAFFFWIVDIRKSKRWAVVLRPAGTATLTCYLVPYVLYAFNTMTGIDLPQWLHTGTVGLMKCFVFALFVVWITGKLNDKGVKLKI